jgi:hypothetical protein
LRFFQRRWITGTDFLEAGGVLGGEGYIRVPFPPPKPPENVRFFRGFDIGRQLRNSKFQHRSNRNKPERDTKIGTNKTRPCPFFRFIREFRENASVLY